MWNTGGYFGVTGGEGSISEDPLFLNTDDPQSDEFYIIAENSPSARSGRYENYMGAIEPSTRTVSIPAVEVVEEPVNFYQVKISFCEMLCYRHS